MVVCLFLGFLQLVYDGIGCFQVQCCYVQGVVVVGCVGYGIVVGQEQVVVIVCVVVGIDY